MAAVAHVQGRTSGTFSGSATSDARDGRFTGKYHGAHQASTTGSTTLSGTLGSAVWWITGAVDVIAASAGVSITPAQGTVTLTGRGLSLGHAINMPDEV